MNDKLATYSFLPWLRKGLANNILEDDGEPSVKLRASIPVGLKISATDVDGDELPESTVNRTVNIYGPGDIIGIDSKAIVKNEPRNWITNFEPNYLPYVDFYDEDFPWRYTPARNDGDRLRPWLTLVVLKEEEFKNGPNVKDRPLPYFNLKDGKRASDIFPNPDDLWAWAHVHVNTDLSNGAEPNTADPADVTAEIKSTTSEDRDKVYSRILSPRKLEANAGYFAFLIPTFESGRLAGLGRDIPSDLVATKTGWENDANNEFPYYHRWFFRTGNIGDFEYLVNLLEPRLADKKVGVRDIDVLHPGSNLPAIDNADLNGVLKLGGALRVPFATLSDEDKQEVIKYDEWNQPYPHGFTEAMAKRVNLADDYIDDSREISEINKESDITVEGDSGDPDPVITSPLYGRWHALQKRLLKERDGTGMPHNKNWVHELNLDPRFRVAAGTGTRVVQKNQEEYMHAAWEQVGDILEANNKLRYAQMAKEVSTRFYAKHVTPLYHGKAFVFSAPVQKRVIYKNKTVHKNVEESVVPPAVTTGTFRSMTRPRGRTMKRLDFNDEITPDNLIERINNGDVIVVPPKTDPEGAINLSDIADEVKPKIPGFLEKLLKKYKWFRFVPLILLLLLLIIIFLLFGTVMGYALLGVMALALLWLHQRFGTWKKEIDQAEAVSQDSQTPESVDDYPNSPDFQISTPGSGFTPSTGNTDSAEAQNFKIALKGVFTLVNTKFPEPERKKLDFADITKHIITSINPDITIPKRTFSTIKIPARIWGNMVEKFTPVMAHPEIDLPMYKPLADISSELFLPNINLIEQNSITLLENNQKFIESYMVGLNHEMSKELLWREYPTDLRGTYFRQFWDVSSFLPPKPVPEDIKEQLRDVPPIHKWHKTSSPAQPARNELGRQSGSDAQLVLVIRGELLKKYPTAVVYAHKADWGLNSDGEKDVNEERVFAELTESEKEDPPTTKIKTPLFEAKVEPDIYFFGFDLESIEARGTLKPTSTSDDPGWFFIIKERPGEPRFGLDVEKAKNEANEEKLINWNNLSWKDIGTPDGSCIELDKTITFDIYDADKDQENEPNADDVQATFHRGDVNNPGTNAAELAYILYQVPVLVGVHASRLLPS